MNDPAQAESAPSEIQDRVSTRFARQGLMSHLGAQLTFVGRGRVHLRLPLRAEVSQQDGYAHAGATSAIADTAGGLAALTCFSSDSAVLAVEFKINFLAPAAGEYLEAQGLVLKSGRTLTVCRLDVFAIRDERRVLVAAGQQTLMCVPIQTSTTGA